MNASGLKSNLIIFSKVIKFNIINKLSCSFLLILLSLPASSQENETIDNAKLIELTKEKLGDDIIISLIQSSTTKFECSITDILKLKKAGVSEPVLSEVLKVCNSDKISKSDETNINNPDYPHPSGIYIYEKTNTGFVLKKTYATVVTQEKSGGFGENLKARLTLGFAKSASVASLNGKTANVKCSVGAIFYFYFEQDSKDATLSNWWFRNATSPNEFTLLKLTKTGDTREFEKGKSDSYTYQSGLDEKKKIEFTFEEIRPGVFKLQTKMPLTEGEYCFLYSATVPSRFSNDKVFDFSVTT